MPASSLGDLSICVSYLHCHVVMQSAFACRLYSSAHYNDTFPKHTPPEILNTPLEGVVLLLKSLAVDKVSINPNMESANFHQY